MHLPMAEQPLHPENGGILSPERYPFSVDIGTTFFDKAVGVDFMFMGGNVNTHRDVDDGHVDDFLEKEDIIRMIWTAISLDHSPKKNVWDALESVYPWHHPSQKPF
ncbi:hypothetical protein AVEN_234796-1 [Araneus ventricosus]|uniref:Uncharacterized protein n=1 Tax=Araneus ventricosus TaxID=182803 RepID=A0A4Y2F6E0_ARAVE|nr:hypothetical protein AVEN_234796-1 [Araneus ventricosus]